MPRFKLEKLEARIAPSILATGCSGSSGTSGSSGSGSSGTSGTSCSE